MATIPTENDEKDIDKLNKLKKGDTLFSIEFSRDGKNNKNEIIVHEFEFQKYEKYENKNSKLENVEKNNDEIWATLINKKYPKVKIKGQNIRYGYFFSVKDAVDSQIEIIKMILKTLEDFNDGKN